MEWICSSVARCIAQCNAQHMHMHIAHCTHTHIPETEYYRHTLQPIITAIAAKPERFCHHRVDLSVFLKFIKCNKYLY